MPQARPTNTSSTTPWTTVDHDNYRRTINGKRHYIDVGLDQPAPSATSIKPEKVFRARTPLGALAPLDAIRAAEWIADNRDLLDDLDTDMLIEEVATAPARALRQAGDRGTEAHDALSAVILGHVTPSDAQAHASDEAAPYVRAGLAFMADYGVDWLATEVIVAVPDLGIAGTIDAIADIGGAITIIDWKTRAKRHGAYPQEVAQLGLYSRGKWLVHGPHPGTQVPMPTIERLAVVSLAPDATYALYPVDRTLARDASECMYAAWQHSQWLAQYGQQAIGPAVLASHVDPQLIDRVNWIRARIGALTADARAAAVRSWPTDAPRKAGQITDHGQVDAIATHLDRIEARHNIPFGPLDPALPLAAASAPSLHKRGQRT